MPKRAYIAFQHCVFSRQPVRVLTTAEPLLLDRAPLRDQTSPILAADPIH
ncbi:hypothetical protein REIFOR_02211 [Reinekea forsetii]|uniref:Uncharacterized protein n=1 Tax=Reinekea forsetii TaxID=1336806 RepID=A0A2K8KVZ1_9GAMM|nr:hypothetical protein REIFOR_02211 [Reinekea forsetii]